jgi:Gas vesicle synthesis protein GvpL/GvpF
MKQPRMSALKLFGIAAVESPSVDSIAEGTTLIHYRGLGAIVQPAVYAATPAGDAEAEAESYAAILEEAFRHGALLPAPPGTIFKSDGTLSHWLELHYFTLTDTLSLVEGQVMARVSISAGRSVKDNGVTKSFQALGAESLRLLRGHSSATVVLPLAKEETSEGMVVCASFLVANERWEAFQETVSQEKRRHPAVDIRLTGPWPPYDFVRMQFGG